VSQRTTDTAPGSLVPLSLFEGDAVNRLFALLHLGSRRPRHLLGRAAVLVALTWFSVALIALIKGPPYVGLQIDGSNFFADFAAYAQFIIALPLFVVAEAIVGRATRDAGEEFAQSGLVRDRNRPALALLHRDIERLRKSWWSDIACWLIGSLLSAAVIVTEFLHPPAHTWHTYVHGGIRYLSAPGYWEFFVALPLLNYWWLRHIWKILLWCRYLYGVSRLPLDLVATHPDRTGGVGFVSEVQGHFAWVILAYGISNVAATVGYKLALENASIWDPPVWGPIAGFVIGAPLLFLLPLFMFTKQLFRAKRRALKLYRARVMEHARLFEKQLLPRSTEEIKTFSGAVDLNVMSQFSKLFESCEKMRVVPFDLRSMSQLIASTLGTVLSILPAKHLELPLGRFLEFVVKVAELLGHTGH
jgi:hypothetical protein